jgi:hypothetical protein
LVRPPANWLSGEVLDVFAVNEQAARHLQRFQALSLDELGDGLPGDPAEARCLSLRNPFVKRAF